MARKNFAGSTSRLLIVIMAALIMLSAGAVVSEGSRRCYWCGPLAEQVHRSQRAPACDDLSDQVTVCDPGFTHCAVVATSPPYVESRLCVKLYQDECYPLYCNSSKTWRMTCPCQGDLCNGPNTQRETNAFSVLPKLVMKTKSTRISKRSRQTLPVQFIQNKNDKTLIITNTSAIDKNNEYIDYNVKNNSITEIFLLNETESVLVNVIEKINIEATENILSFNDTDTVFENDNTKTTESDMYDSDTATEIETQAFIRTTELRKSITETKMTHIPSTSMVKELKPSEELPTAEALQQNGSPVIVSEKTTLPTTTTITETTLLTTLESNIARTTEHTKPKKNIAMKINANMFLLLLCYLHSLVIEKVTLNDLYNFNS